MSRALFSLRCGGGFKQLPAALWSFPAGREKRTGLDHVGGSRTDDDGLGLDQFGDSSPAQHGRRRGAVLGL